MKHRLLWKNLVGIADMIGKMEKMKKSDKVFMIIILIWFAVVCLIMMIWSARTIDRLERDRAATNVVEAQEEASCIGCKDRGDDDHVFYTR